jgi:hypothetical protein
MVAPSDILNGCVRLGTIGLGMAQMKSAGMIGGAFQSNEVLTCACVIGAAECEFVTPILRNTL